MTKSNGGDAKSTLYCSFCGKSQHEVRKLIAGSEPYSSAMNALSCAWISFAKKTRTSLVKSRRRCTYTDRKSARVLDDYVIGQFKSQNGFCRWRFTITTSDSGTAPAQEQ